MPFQLLLGLPEGGVRGYEKSSWAGGARFVGRTEQRYMIPNFLGAADAGVAMFADMGKEAAGDVPFGVTSPFVASIGMSLMAAVPQHSARLWRADFAVPSRAGPTRGGRCASPTATERRSSTERRAMWSARERRRSRRRSSRGPEDRYASATLAVSRFRSGTSASMTTAAPKDVATGIMKNFVSDGTSCILEARKPPR